MLRKYVHDPSHVIQHEDIDIREDMTVEERPVEIMDRREQVLRNEGHFTCEGEMATSWNR